MNQSKPIQLNLVEKKMRMTSLLLTAVTLTVAGCHFDASRRPIQPVPTAPGAMAVYCCDSCQISDEAAICDACSRSNEQASCAAPAERLVCVSNRVEEPEGPGTYRVSCF
jgi:hypothetical protein